MTKFLKGATLKDLIMFASIFITIGIMYGSIEANTAHRKDKDIHMPLEKKEELFVTRKEYNQFRIDVTDRILIKLDAIEKRLNAMEAK